MAGQYYYLVSGLPDILLDAGRPVSATTEIMEELDEQLDSADRELLCLTRLTFDNRNLINILEGRPGQFDPRGN